MVVNPELQNAAHLKPAAARRSRKGDFVRLREMRWWCGAYRGRTDRWLHVCDACLAHYRRLEGLPDHWRGLTVGKRKHFVYSRAAWADLKRRARRVGPGVLPTP